MLAAIVLAIPDMNAAAQQGSQIIFWTLREVLPPWTVGLLCAGIAIAQYLCGLATVTSASRMAFAFARDGGLPADELDPANLASELYQAEFDEGLADDLHEQLAAVDRAEMRLAAGTYGVSVESGKPIPDERLEAVPTAERTVEEEGH